MGKPLSSLSLRIISSAVLIPIVMGIIYIGGWLFTAFATLCIAVALYEWLNITKHMQTTALKKKLLYGAGIVYLGFSLFEIIYLRGMEHGATFTVIFMLCIWASDSGAYLFGKKIGGKKMSPTISPNKTWSGYLGALLFPTIILVAIVFLANADGTSFSYFYTILAGVALGITGQSGDLMISAMKRKAGLKDTGALIPGHGGILDRIDALLLALPVFLAYIKFTAE